ncbi:MAG: alanine--tRNA ligase [Candidatus Nanohaloarchaeota archaeon QJJ-9]|nr:alanine--tRNA ligase [Candidatus Nanohaloarchaeota archaeon QJJ-9]
MPTLEELKEKVEREATENPEKFFAVEKLKENGFKRKKCNNCGKHFWTQDEEREVCGEPACSDGYTFINDPPTDKTFSFVEFWEKFSSFMEERGYKPIRRYPVAARWREDTDFVRASIYDFQPYVVSGEVEPPANPLVVPQFSVRFNDIDNVGITGRHYTGFIMTGQHAFTEPDNYKQGRYFEDLLHWLTEGMDIPKEKVILHEDSWGGGGNLGACMEFFVDGLELFNQVYMFYKLDDSERGYSELDTKVLDCGIGYERVVWITHGSETSYEANMPEVVEKLYKKTGVDPDKEIWRKFLPYSGLLNFDEVEDLEKTWKEISDKIGIEKEKLKEEVMPAAAVYSIADHARTLLIAFSDGILPSNTGEKHSLRVIARRALDFIDKYDWDVNMKEVMEWHAEAMEGLYPELVDSLEEAKEIMDYEKEQYMKMREKAEKEVQGMKEDNITEEKLVELYDSHGISPELLQRLGFDTEAPSDFYSKVEERQEERARKEEEKRERKKFDLSSLEKTKLIYQNNEKKTEFDANVLKIIEKDGKSYIVLDKTCFYPTSGGQLHDKGKIDCYEVKDVLKQEGVVLHQVEEHELEEGEEVKGRIDWERREQLMQHHTATHLINAAAREFLGDHIWQEGAKKSKEKARLDISHYKKLTDKEIEEIEEKANQWINEELSVTKRLVKKSEAEKKYGFRIYQGGVPPGNSLRLVDIGGGIDTEACGGTHVENTREIENIEIVNTKKVQDGVIRIEFKSGKALDLHKEEMEAIKSQITGWLELEDYNLEEVAEIFDVKVEHLPKVVERFVDEWKSHKEEIKRLKEVLAQEKDTEYQQIPSDPEELFKEWKKQKKDIDKLQKALEKEIKKEIRESEKELVEKEVDIEDVGALIRVVKDILRKEEEKSIILKGENAVIGGKGDLSDVEVKEKVEEKAEVVQESGNIIKGFNLKD